MLRFKEKSYQWPIEFCKHAQEMPLSVVSKSHLLLQVITDRMASADSQLFFDLLCHKNRLADLILFGRA